MSSGIIVRWQYFWSQLRLCLPVRLLLCLIRACPPTFDPLSINTIIAQTAAAAATQTAQLSFCFYT